MNLSLKQINTLPVPTWNRLGFNDAELSGPVPEVGPYRGERSASKVPEGVAVTFGNDAVSGPETGMGNEASGYVLEHRNCGATVRVRAGVRAKEPVVFSYLLDGENPCVVDANTIVAEEGSEVTVVLSYRSDEETEGFHGGMTRIFAEKGASVHLVEVQLLNGRCVHFDDIGALAAEGGSVDVMQAELGGRTAFAGCRARLEGKGSSLNLDALYFGDRSRSIDINYVAEHVGPKSKSEIRVNGALLDESRKTFRGTIDFKKGSKKAVGQESETNLLFSPRARSRTAPLILCAEEDVDGRHAASTGKIDENTLFYLMSRGLSELDAKKLMIEAQFAPAAAKILDPGLRDAISEYVKERLNAIEPVS